MSRTIELASRFSSPLPPEETAEYLASLDALVLFAGYQLVPGIIKAQANGATRTVTSPRGRTRTERVLVSTDSQMMIELYPAFPEKMLYRSIVERFELDPKGSGTEVTRTMTLSLRPGMRPLAAWGAHMLRVAIARNNEVLEKALSLQPEKETWY